MVDGSCWLNGLVALLEGVLPFTQRFMDRALEMNTAASYFVGVVNDSALSKLLRCPERLLITLTLIPHLPAPFICFSKAYRNMQKDDTLRAEG